MHRPARHIPPHQDLGELTHSLPSKLSSYHNHHNTTLGPLCSSCDENFYRDTLTYECSDCDKNDGTRLQYMAALLLGLTVLCAVVFWCTCREGGMLNAFYVRQQNFIITSKNYIITIFITW